VKKLAVVSSASGSGGTTVGQELAHRLGVPFHELDGFFWKPGWVESTAEEFRSVVEPIVATDVWRLLRRTVRRARSGEVLWDGNRESLRQAFLSRDSLILFTLRHFRARRRTYPVRFADYDVLRLRSQAEIDRFLRSAE